MKRNLFVSLGVLVTLLIAPPLHAGQPESGPVLTRAQQETFLRSAEIENLRSIPAGTTAPQRATLFDGTVSHDAQVQCVDIFKREFKTARGTELNFRDSYRFNIAAYLLDKHLDLNMVPVSVERQVRGESCAVTWWVDDVAMDERARLADDLRAPNPATWAFQMYKVRVFDQLIANTDRNTGNLLSTDDWRIWMIDHTRAFRTYHTLRTPGDMVACDRRLLANLRKVDESTLNDLLTDHLAPLEIQSLAARASLIVEHFDALIAEKGGAVLYGVVPPASR